MPDESGKDVLPVMSPDKTDKRLRAFAWGNERFVAHKPKVDGWENYNEIAADPSQNFVIASTHRTDAEVQTVIDVFASLRKLGLVTHRANVQDSNGKWNLPAKLIGKDNFMVLGVDRDPEQTTEARDRDEYDLSAIEMDIMARRMQDERITPVVAAHRPTYHSPLPPKAGLADVMLAHLSGSRRILPVAVDWLGSEPIGNSHEMGKVVKNLVTRNRPDVAVHIAPAVHLPEIPQEALRAAMNALSSESRRQLTPEQKTMAMETLPLLRSQSKEVMQALADTLPEADRGVWGPKGEVQQAEVKQADISAEMI